MIDQIMKQDKKERLGTFMSIAIFAGLIGWFYEFIFYYFNYGMQGFFLQGGNFLPWINIYAYGALLIILLVYKFNIEKRPFMIFLVSFFATGILEYFSGLVIFKLTGNRYWDYNTEIWNFGNIGGFVCLRSVLAFGLSGVALVYCVAPAIEKLKKRLGIDRFLKITFIIFAIILTDELYNLIIARFFNLPRALDIYRRIGFKYRPWF